MVAARAVFESKHDEYLKFDREEAPASRRPDVAAFMRLDALLGGSGDLVACAEHDEIWLDVNIDKLNEVASEQDIVFLIRCGVRYDADTDSLAMFV